MLKNWFTTFLYQVKHNKLFTFLNVLGLSIGISSVFIAILYWEAEHKIDAWNPNKENVYQAHVELSGGEVWANVQAPLAPKAKSLDKNIQSYCYFNTYHDFHIVKYQSKKTFIEKILRTQSNFFDFFPFKIIHGSYSNYRKKGYLAIEKQTAQKIFGMSNPINKTIKILDEYWKVGLVYEKNENSSISGQIFLNNMQDRLKENTDDWGNYNYGLLLKLGNNNRLENTLNKINSLLFNNSTKRFAKSYGISPEEFVKKFGRVKFYLIPLKTLHFYKDCGSPFRPKGNIQFLKITLAISVLILLLSIINYSNHVTAVILKRTKEFGIRQIIGASKKNIFLQFLFETSIVILFSSLISLCITELLIKLIELKLSNYLIFNINENIEILIITIVSIIIISAIIPAFSLIKLDTNKLIRGEYSKGKNGSWLKNGLLVFQFVIAAFFLIGSSIVNKQLNFMNNKELGFKGDQIISISQYNYNFSTYEVYQKNKQQIEKIKGVESSAIGAFSIGGQANSTSSFQYKDHEIQGWSMPVVTNTMQFFDFKLKEGRYFDPNRSLDTVESVIINETCQKMMGEKNPIGKIIPWNEKELKIIGIAKDFHIAGLHAKIQPMLFFDFNTVPWMKCNFNFIYVKIKPTNMQATIARLEKYWKKNIEPDYPFRYEFVNKQFEISYKNYIIQQQIFSILNIIVITIALLGLFALSSYSIERRMKEIAIRKTLGAETKSLLFILSRQYIYFCIIGVLIAVFPTYFLLNMWLKNFVYRIEIDAWPFIFGFIILITLTLTIVISKAYLATKVNVLKYLRYE